MRSGEERARFADVRELTTAIARGDEQAFDVFYAEYSPRVYRLLLVITRGHEDLAAELHQTVMITAARKLGAFETEGALWAWLAQVARNKWKDLCRKRARENLALAFFEPEQATPVENLERIEDALRELRAPERELLESAYFENLSQRAISERTGRSVKGIESALARIRQKLRTLLNR